MTSLVAVRCSDGVVIGADSALTIGSAGGRISTIEHQTSQKLRVIDGQVIVAGTGQAGLMQRFHAAIERAVSRSKLDGATGIEVGKQLADLGLRDFSETHLEKFDYSALIAFSTNGEPHLCELDGLSGFQPEIKEPLDLWHVSAGSGQSITDPFLALVREAFWKDGPPNLRGGIFTVLWTLKHVCRLNTGGVADPVKLAVLDQGDKCRARLLTAEELAEHDNVVEAAMKHLGAFRDILEGRMATEAVPPRPRSTAG